MGELVLDPVAQARDLGLDRVEGGLGAVENRDDLVADLIDLGRRPDIVDDRLRRGDDAGVRRGVGLADLLRECAQQRLRAAGLAVGLALQGSLSNFAAGVLIVVFRPYKVGDFIEAAGISGSVEGVQILTTILKTPDNKKIIVPNSQIMAGEITMMIKAVPLTLVLNYFFFIEFCLPIQAGSPITAVLFQHLS